MSDAPDTQFPFASFSPAGGMEMLEKMWRMMQVPGMGGSLAPSSVMSDMMAPMTNIDELDKRITDMRAVEQWLKLNLSMLQSAIQGLEVQRATLATLKAFGAFAQSSLEQAAANAPAVSKAFAPGASAAAAEQTPEPHGSRTEAGAESAAQAGAAAIDPALWWNVLQTQFNQIAAMALAAQPAAAAAAAETAVPEAPDAPAKKAARPSVRKDAAGKTSKGAAAGPKAGGSDH
jgi:hypothetical protein